MMPPSMIELSPMGVSHGHKHYPRQYSLQTSKPNTHFLVQVVPPGVRRKHESGIPDLLAVLAPLAAIPLLGSLAVSSFTTMLTLTGLGRRRKRDVALHKDVLDQLTSHNRTLSLLHLNVANGTEADEASQFNPFESLTNSSTDQQTPFAKELPIFGESDSKASVNIPVICSASLIANTSHPHRIPSRNCFSSMWCSSTCVSRADLTTTTRSLRATSPVVECSQVATTASSVSRVTTQTWTMAAFDRSSETWPLCE